MTRRVPLPSLALALALLALAAPAAFGHAAFEGASPAPGERVESAPRRIVLTFSEPLNRRLSEATLETPGGRGVESRQTVSGRRIVLAPSRSLGRGAYRVRWRTVSTDDAHPLEGSFGFGVRAAAGAAGQAVEQSPLAAGGWARALARAALYAALLLFAGALIVRALAGVEWPAPRRAPPSDPPARGSPDPGTRRSRHAGARAGDSRRPPSRRAPRPPAPAPTRWSWTPGWPPPRWPRWPRWSTPGWPRAGCPWRRSTTTCCSSTPGVARIVLVGAALLALALARPSAARRGAGGPGRAGVHRGLRPRQLGRPEGARDRRRLDPSRRRSGVAGRRGGDRAGLGPRAAGARDPPRRRPRRAAGVRSRGAARLRAGRPRRDDQRAGRAGLGRRSLGHVLRPRPDREDPPRRGGGERGPHPRPPALPRAGGRGDPLAGPAGRGRARRRDRGRGRPAGRVPAPAAPARGRHGRRELGAGVRPVPASRRAGGRADRRGPGGRAGGRGLDPPRGRPGARHDPHAGLPRPPGARADRGARGPHPRLRDGLRRLHARRRARAAARHRRAAGPPPHRDAADEVGPERRRPGPGADRARRAHDARPAQRARVRADPQRSDGERRHPLRAARAEPPGVQDRPRGPGDPDRRTPMAEGGRGRVGRGRPFPAASRSAPEAGFAGPRTRARRRS